MAEISQGVANKLRANPFPSAFFAFLHNYTNIRPLFDILDTCYKEIHKIYFFYFFLFFFYLIRKFSSLQCPRFIGVRKPFNDQRLTSPPPEMLRGWRRGTRLPPKSASAIMYKLVKLSDFDNMKCAMCIVLLHLLTYIHPVIHHFSTSIKCTSF